MAILFFDTSALVKRYYEETGTEEVDRLIEGEDRVVISSLSIIETVSAFRRKYNRNQLSEDHLNRLLNAFFVEALETFHIVPMEESVVSISFDLVLQDDLRTLDSLQLSTALSIDPGDDSVSFVSADSELVSVAQRRDLETIYPST